MKKKLILKKTSTVYKVYLICWDQNSNKLPQKMKKITAVKKINLKTKVIKTNKKVFNKKKFMDSKKVFNKEKLMDSKKVFNKKKFKYSKKYKQNNYKYLMETRHHFPNKLQMMNKMVKQMEEKKKS